MFSTIQIFGRYLFWPISIIVTTTAVSCAVVLIKPNTARDQSDTDTHERFRPSHAAFQVRTVGSHHSIDFMAVFLVCYSQR